MEENHGQHQHQDRFGSVPIRYRGHSDSLDVIQEGGGFGRRPLIYDRGGDLSIRLSTSSPFFSSVLLSGPDMVVNFRNFDFDPRNLPPKHLEAIGLAVACSAQTEDHMQMAIARLLGVDAEIGWAITSHMTAPLRENVLKSIAEIKIDNLDDLDELDALIDKVRLAADKRNALVHHLWCHDEKTKEVFLLKTTARNTVRADVLPMSLDTIIEDAGFIYDAGIELLRFLISKNLFPRLPPGDRPRFHKTKAARKKRASK